MTRRIEVSIGELVLHGVAHRDRGAVAEGLERELARILTERGLPQARSRDVARVDGGTVEQGPLGDTGAGIARAVYGGLVR